LTANIISVGQLDERGYQVLVEHGELRVRDEERCLLAKIRRNAGRLYVLNINIAQPVCLAARGDEEAWVWHARFGHLNFRAFRKMGRDGIVNGMPLLSQVEQVCMPRREAPADAVPTPSSAPFIRGAAAAPWRQLRSHHPSETQRQPVLSPARG
jgi:hypothetical protein